mmetsp:Transcript_6055/g.24542  ORF Transcript_6055/g.24542 Transcript_6055/m.24542 type:complete len:248 (-) Transcript_6055:200-943(-)
MSAHDATFEAVAHRSLGDVQQALGGFVTVLVDVEVQVQTALAGESEDDVQQRGHVVPARRVLVVGVPPAVRARHRGAEDPAVRFDVVRELFGRDFVSEKREDVQRYALELNLALPLPAELVKHRPRDGALLRAGHDVRANRGCAVRVRGFQAELHASTHVLAVPVRLILRARVVSPRERSRFVPRSFARVPFVDVAVDIAEGGPAHASVDVDLAEVARARFTSGDDGVNPSFAYLDVHQAQTVAVRL